MKKNNWLRLLFVNLLLCLGAVILYSPGLLALRITDASILRAGLSIICVPALLGGFWLNNKSILYEHTWMISSSGEYVAISAKNGDVLETLKASIRQIKDKEIIRLSSDIYNCIAEIFARSREPGSGYTQEEIDSKLEYYFEVFETTMQREIAYEKYQTGAMDQDIHDEICDTLNLLKSVFGRALDALLNKALADIELDQTVLRHKISMDGYESSPFEEAKGNRND